jgi:cytochrome c peroxidase
VVELPGAELLPPTDKGRFQATESVSDQYVFKVPSWRNVALTPPYFHTGRAWDLRQAVAVMGSARLGIQLSDEEIDKITAFLHSLTGDQPQIVYPILPPSVATTPRPQPQARAATSCVPARQRGLARRFNLNPWHGRRPPTRIIPLRAG